MLVAALYDIHGNLPALDAVLRDVARHRVERIVVGGDIVPGPIPRETLQRLRAVECPVDFIVGNGELAVLAEAQGRDSGVPAPVRENIRWNASELDPADLQFMKRWPTNFRMRIKTLGEVLFCHATPENAHDIFTRLTPEDAVLPLLGKAAADLIVCGHTHMQFDRRVGKFRIVNAGSVGMPFGKPGAYWLLLGPEVALRHTSYDLRGAALLVQRSRYPEAEKFAAQNVLHPRSEEEMLEAFSRWDSHSC